MNKKRLGVPNSNNKITNLHKTLSTYDVTDHLTELVDELAKLKAR